MYIFDMFSFCSPLNVVEKTWYLQKKRVRCAVMVSDVLNFENSFNTNYHKTNVSSSINSLSISEICVPLI